MHLLLMLVGIYLVWNYVIPVLILLALAALAGIGKAITWMASDAPSRAGDPPPPSA